MKNENIRKAKEHFAKIVEEQLNRVKSLKEGKWQDPI